MFRDILSSRGIIFGLVFFVLIVGAAQWYSWQVRRSSPIEMARTNRFLQQFENKKETRTTQDATVQTDGKPLQSMETSWEIDDTDIQTSEETEAFIDAQENFDLTDMFLSDDSTSEDESDQSVYSESYQVWVHDD